MDNKRMNRAQGHWLLAKMGKKVLRPGGKELTLKMIDNLDITVKDNVVEFAPGLGYTANLVLKKNPKTYTAVELNENAAKELNKKIKGSNITIILGNAAKTGLSSESYSKVYGEAMLTMQADKRKSVITSEAHRILKRGGLYGIHELGLTPDNISEDMKKEIHKALAEVINVNARPLTETEWKTLIENEGFRIIKVETNSMHLLEKKRMVEDEGFFRSIKIAYNIMTHKPERQRIKAMRNVFKKYKDHLMAVSIVAEKI